MLSICAFPILQRVCLVLRACWPELLSSETVLHFIQITRLPPSSAASIPTTQPTFRGGDTTTSLTPAPWPPGGTGIASRAEALILDEGGHGDTSSLKNFPSFSNFTGSVRLLQRTLTQSPVASRAYLISRIAQISPPLDSSSRSCEVRVRHADHRKPRPQPRCRCCCRAFALGLTDRRNIFVFFWAVAPWRVRHRRRRH